MIPDFVSRKYFTKNSKSDSVLFSTYTLAELKVMLIKMCSFLVMFILFLQIIANVLKVI